MSTGREVENIRPLISRMRQDVIWLRRPTDNFPGRVDARVTPARLARHVDGGPYVGLSFILPGENTTLAAAYDLDSHGGETPWPTMLESAVRLRDSLILAGYCPVLFRSSGGRGVHIYVVWDDPQDAYSVRKEMGRLLAENGLSSGTKGVSHNQVEVFPKQDQVRPGGYGNMIILPLANKSVPLDPDTLEDLPADYPVSWPVSAPVPYVEHAVRDTTPGAISLGMADLRRALAAIPQETAPLDYGEWRNVIFALHYATDGSAEGLALAHEFSSRSGKYDPEFLDNRVWPYVHADGGITDRYITWLASQHGYQDCQASDFDGLGSEAPVTPRKRFQPIPAHEFAGYTPSVHWLIKDVLPAADLVMVYGASGSGKTFAVLDMAMAIARGVEWRGRRTHPGRVVYLVAEGANGFRRRLAAYAIANGIKLEDTDISVIPEVPFLVDKKDTRDLIDAIRDSGGARLVVLDTFAKVTAGANENSGEDMGLALAHAQRISEVLGCTVVLVHHSGKDESRGSRGWSGIKGALDTEMEVTRAGENRAISVTKQKDGEEGVSFGFRLRDVLVGFQDEDGGEMKSCVCEPTDTDARRVRARAKLGPEGETLLSRLRDLPADGDGWVDPFPVVGGGRAAQKSLRDLEAAGELLVRGDRVKDAHWSPAENAPLCH